MGDQENNKEAAVSSNPSKQDIVRPKQGTRKSSQGDTLSDSQENNVRAANSICPQVDTQQDSSAKTSQGEALGTVLLDELPISEIKEEQTTTLGQEDINSHQQDDIASLEPAIPAEIGSFEQRIDLRAAFGDPPAIATPEKDAEIDCLTSEQVNAFAAPVTTFNGHTAHSAAESTAVCQMEWAQPFIEVLKFDR
ncbi:MAG: hypothetical protein Q9166_005297 [cf. Caloplaca sp. 2 TL-2023]